MRIAIRVDATPEIGTGHLVRCLTLADALRTSGGQAAFFTSALPGRWAGTVRARGHELHEAAAAMPPGGAEDVEWMRSQLQGAAWDWLVVDHYRIDAVWERAVLPSGARLLAIDDLADRRHDCDLLLDQNFLPDRESAYRGLVPARAGFLLGPSFALLRPEYAAARASLPRAQRRLDRVLVFFGGSDQRNLTERALEALAHPALRRLHADVVCGYDPVKRARVDALALARGRTTVFGPREHLADLMAAADVAIGAGGATTWERMCLGLASLTVTVASNQEEVAAWLASQHLIKLLGPADAVTAGDMRRALEALARGDDWPDVERGMKLSDGQGAQRVVASLQ